MLIISRKKHEIVILTLPDGRTIEVCVADIRRGREDKIRLGFTAPKDISVNRAEVQAEIDETNAVADALRDDAGVTS